MQTVKGFFDLCVQQVSFKKSSQRHMIETLHKNGYRTIAINYELQEPYEDVGNEGASSTGVKDGGSNKRKGKGNNSQKATKGELPSLVSIEDSGELTIMHRLTIKLASKDFFSKIAKLDGFKRFDIIAVVPVNQEVIGFICADMPVDIIAMLPNEMPRYRLFRKHYNQLVARGIYFELPYTAAIMSDSCRRTVITVAHNYHLIGKSRNVIVSSGAKSVWEIRSPYDIINLGIILGLSHAQTKMAVMQNCRNVYYKAVSQRYGKVAMLAGIRLEHVSQQDKGDKQEKERATNMDASFIEVTDDDEVTYVGHQLKKIKTNST